MDAMDAMDVELTASVVPSGEPLAPESISLGVPALPSPADRVRPPVPVPSAPVPPAAWPTVPTDPIRSPAGSGAPEGLPAGKPAPAGAVDDATPGFGPGVSAKLGTYVYLLVDPRTGRPISVGRGQGDRCFREVRAARSGTDPGAENALVRRIREIESSGKVVRVDILRYGLSPSEARLVEASAQEALGLSLGAKLSGQRQAAADLDRALAKRAKFKRIHPVVLLRAGGKGSDTSYEVARHGWRIGRRWTDLGSPRSPRWAVIVAGETVATVYRIEGWEPTPLRSRSRHGTSSTAARSTYRFSFVGPVDPELQRRYAGRSVAGYLGAGSQSPVSYVWCGPHWVDAPV